ncbi:unnamed protein product [Spirodela intermedia]|uniref:Secreted protein n=1 Tax=Spirodela intermedia TaxID=51605 RepID=A0ABN7ECV0_SPIIN|nr:unnamed protein product [Spirodela intermedia]
MAIASSLCPSLLLPSFPPSIFLSPMLVLCEFSGKQSFGVATAMRVGDDHQNPERFGRIVVQCPRLEGSPWTKMTWAISRSSRSFILRSAQQEEALHRIWYALKRWRLVSRRIVLFPTTACSSINQR